MKLKNCIDNFINYLVKEKRYSIHTQTSYSVALRQFLDYLDEKFKKEYNNNEECSDNNTVNNTSIAENMDIESIEASTIRPFIGWLYDEGKNRNSIRLKVGSIKSFFKYCYKKEFTKNNIGANINIPQKEKNLPNFILKDEVKKWLDEIELDTFFDYRNKAIIELLYSSGLRISEALNIEINDFDFEKKQVKVFGKGKKDRIVPVGENAILSIKNYLTQIPIFRQQNILHKHTKKIFINKDGGQLSAVSAWKIVKSSMQHNVNCNRNSPHILRHSFATHLLDNGADLLAVSKMLGHASLSATEVYTHISTERLKKAYKLAHPKARN